MEVQAALEAARQTNAGRNQIDEIVGIMKEERGYLLDIATAGVVHIDGRGLLEA